ncbi:MAG: hypothetical protein J6O41_02815 [Clostridia bacterium]|nr:hypothetical protein [Clostridia bacterium]
MKKIKKGDIVVRKSHNKDIIFLVSRIIDIKDKKLVILKGVVNRIEVDSYIDDLELIDKKRLKKELNYFNDRIKKRIEKIKLSERDNLTLKNRHTMEKFITGKILHLDGDRRYSEKSLYYYRKLGLNAVVKNISENKQPQVVYKLLKQYNPDILVVTGHDRYDKKENRIQ